MNTKSRITNTASSEVDRGWLMGWNPDAIEAQEARGQEQLVNSDQLPVTCRPNREAFEEMGITFGPALKGDPLFCNATLPAGWKKRPTDHSMWSELVDDKGAVCAMIFYKAAFYDRDAFMRLGAA